MDNYAAPWNNESNVYQSKDKESDAGAEDELGNAPPGPNEIDGIQEGDPSEADKDKEPPVNMDADTPDNSPSGLDEEDEDLSTNKGDNQLEGPSRKIP